MHSFEVPANLNLTLTSWFNLTEVSIAAENSVYFMCDILGRFKECK